MTRLADNLWRWQRAQDNWPGTLSDSEQLYVHDVIHFVSGRTINEPGPCPPACREYLSALVHTALVPLALPVLLEMDIATEDPEPEP